MPPDIILVIEDESDVADLIRYHLKREKFTVLHAGDGVSGYRMACEHRPSVVVLDLMLPGLSGLEICRKLKADKETASMPVLMLTARGMPEERIKGLELGADDYVTKPFSPRELVLRVQSLLRRSQVASRSEVTELGAFRVDRALLEIRLAGERLDLTAIEFKLLALLIDRCGHVQSRDSLLKDVWGYRSNVDTRTVDTHIRRLREKLGVHADHLETIRGEGYRFVSLLAAA